MMEVSMSNGDGSGTPPSFLPIPSSIAGDSASTESEPVVHQAQEAASQEPEPAAASDPLARSNNTESSELKERRSPIQDKQQQQQQQHRRKRPARRVLDYVLIPPSTAEWAARRLEYQDRQARLHGPRYSGSPAPAPATDKEELDRDASTSALPAGQDDDGPQGGAAQEQGHEQEQEQSLSNLTLPNGHNRRSSRSASRPLSREASAARVLSPRETDKQRGEQAGSATLQNAQESTGEPSTAQEETTEGDAQASAPHIEQAEHTSPPQSAEASLAGVSTSTPPSPQRQPPDVSVGTFYGAPPPQPSPPSAERHGVASQQVETMSDSDDDIIQSSTHNRAGRTGPRKIKLIVRTPSPEAVEELSPDDEIRKILGRKRDSSEEPYRYSVKLTDGRRVIVDEDTLHSYQDLIEVFEDRIEDGSYEDNVFNDDSSEPGDDESEDEVEVVTRRSRRNANQADKDYAGQSARESSENDEDEEGEVGDEDEAEEEEEADDDDVVYVQPTRRSSRAQTKTRPDYAMQDEDALPSDSDVDMLSDGSDESVDLTMRNKKPPTGRGRGRGRPRKSQTQDGAFLVTSSDEEADEGELLPERVHKNECRACHASSAKILLPMYMRKKNKKRQDPDEWGEEDIVELGSWIECGTCANVQHWKCLSRELQGPLKKEIINKHATVSDPKPFLNIEKTFTIPACLECLKPKGTRCMLCMKSEKVDKLERGLPPSHAVDAESASKNKGADGMTGTGTVEADKAGPSQTTDGLMDVDKPDCPKDQPNSDTGQEATASKKALMFRCDFCKRAAHYSCIPEEDVREWQVHNHWRCKDCVTWGQPDAVLAWRPVVDVDGDQAEAPASNASQPHPPSSPTRKTAKPADLPSHKDSAADAEYLVKFKDQSFRHAKWVPHAWLFSAYPHRLRNFLVKGPSVDIPIDNEEDDDHLEDFGFAANPDGMNKIPKEWTTPDRILEVRYRAGRGNMNSVPSQEMGRKISDVPEDSVHKIDELYVKWQGLPYESATWERWPEENDAHYEQYIKAYAVFLKARHVRIPRVSEKDLRTLDKPRAEEDFHALSGQPAYIHGGQLMSFQLEGISWLYYNWWIKKGCILADEMGLGKTVQIISYISLLFKKEGCQPFLVVVPNSTLQNWLREFEKWAPPEMRVVPYYGTKASKAIIEKYEMFTSGMVAEQQLRAHVIVTTYESLERGQALFKRVPRWESMVVDEAQRLKGGSKGLLWKALMQIRYSHPVLLTGTPVNNNLDELFNLLHFIDRPAFSDLDALHDKYENLTPELVLEVQEMAQDYFLRRTKEAVLNLPPLSEVIVPLNMSALQKVVYKSVLEQNYDALAAIYDSTKAKGKQKMNKARVTNVLMELRKTLCHPYLVREELEHDSTLDERTLHKTLVEASSKLTFLSKALRILRERGHRVLIFSQFVIVLNILERFLEGEKIKFCRLDGSTAQSDRQEAIDAFNAENSDISVFILSTRAGGVGINLATADTVIIYDADFNPFQDLQAISRAHRIGQKKKVMCFKLMVKNSCEEKIVEAGKKKMVLEQLIVDSLEDKKDNEDEAPNNVESLLLFGAKALFEENPNEPPSNEYDYSDKDIESLIDKTLAVDESDEAVAEKKRKTAEANKAFSYARVWEREKIHQEEQAEKGEVEAQRGFWTRMLEEQAQKRRDEEVAIAMQSGRGQRKRKANYTAQHLDFLDEEDGSPRKGKKNSEAAGEDPDFNFADSSSDGSDSEFEGPRSIERELSQDGGQPTNKKQKKADVQVPASAPAPAPVPPPPPPSVNRIVYVPPDLNGARPNGYMPPSSYIVRSQSPPDMRHRRSIMLSNLWKRARILEPYANEAINWLTRCTAQTSGQEQVQYMLKALQTLQSIEKDHPLPPRPEAPAPGPPSQQLSAQIAAAAAAAAAAASTAKATATAAGPVQVPNASTPQLAPSQMPARSVNGSTIDPAQAGPPMSSTYQQHV